MVAKYNSRVLIDWLSWTMKRDINPDQSTGDLMNDVMAMCADYVPLLKLMAGGWLLVPGRFPYDKAFKSNDNTVHIYFSHKMPHVLVELSGQACAKLDARIFDILQQAEHAITRIDVAVDVECPNNPKEVLDSIPAGRWRSLGHIVSDTGETCYIGSQKSDRFARVYRYNAPHPRADYMRYEMVYRRNQAKEIAKSINIVGLRGTASAAGNAFGWIHGTWLLRSDDTIKAYRPERNKAKTERWFYTTVVPSTRKMIQEGTVTRAELIEALGLDTE